MPGLPRGVARAGVIAGTATAVSNRVSRRQAERWAEEDQSAYAQPQYAPSAQTVPAAAPNDAFEKLRQLAELRE